jgi:hypothetical protein
MQPMLKPPGTKHLKLNCDDLLSNFAFKINLRRYAKVLLKDPLGSGAELRQTRVLIDRGVGFDTAAGILQAGRCTFNP